MNIKKVPSIIPNSVSEQGNIPNYYCTWHAQSYFNPLNLMKKYPDLYANMNPRRRTATMMNEESLFGKYGLARTLFPTNRNQLYFVLDDGWDVPIVSPNGYYGSLILDQKKFPSYSGTPVERLNALNESLKDLGWKGLGLWIAAQEAPEIMRIHGKEYEEDEENDVDEDLIGDDSSNLALMEPMYWVERIKWMDEAKVEYWKVDWGMMCNVSWFREMLSNLAHKYAPRLYIEHAVILGPLNGQKGSETFGVLPFEKSELMRDLASFSQVLRLYDVTGQLQIPTMLERASKVISSFDVEQKTSCLLNCEVLPYMGTALGMCIGIMRHPHKDYEFNPSIITSGMEKCEFISNNNGEDDLFTGKPLYMEKRLLEIIRCLNWHKLSPPFPVGAVENLVSDVNLFDIVDLRKRPTWYSKDLDGPTRQAAPSIIFRNSKNIKISLKSREESKMPWLIGSKNPNGAISIATYGRINSQMEYNVPLIDIEITVPHNSNQYGIFGTIGSLKIKEPNISQNSKIIAQDLAKDDAYDITENVEIEKGLVFLKGDLIKTLCFPFNDFDLSEPGIILKILD